LSDFLEKVSSDAPTPGGGSVSALSGSLGVSLLKMVVNITLKKTPELNELKDIQSELDRLQKELTDLIDEDSEAFDKVMSAFKLPKDTDEKKKERSKAIQEAFKTAAEVPFKTAERCAKASDLAVIVAEKGEKNAISDVGCAGHLVKSGFYGAKLNIEINLSAIKDEGFVKKMRDDVEGLMKSLNDNISKTITLVEEGL
jgi:formiminotetrahydrofolate cyclodeaminase